MRTDDLIDLLSTNLDPVDHRHFIRRVQAAILAGLVAALIIVFAVLGGRAELTSLTVWVPTVLKIVATAIILVPASFYLIKLARPGSERARPIALLALPFVAIMLLAVFSLASTPSRHWQIALLSDEWLECVISIPLIAIVPFAAITWVVRQMAPTDLARTGAFIGLVAGCISAIGYAFHCVDDSVPFFTLWYGGTIALCTLAGWKLGPTLLRW